MALRVLLGPVNIAGQASILGRYLRSCGISATSLSYGRPWFGYSEDISLNLNHNDPLAKRGLKILAHFPRELYYDIYHFQFGLSLLPLYVDLPLLRSWHRIIVMHYHGDDIRQLDIVRKYKYNYAKYVTYTEETEERKRKRLAIMRRYARKFFVSTPDLLEFVPEAEWLPIAVDTAQFRQNHRAQSFHENSVRIIHAPTDRLRKGTEFLVHAVKQLQNSGLKVELVLVEKVPHTEVHSRYAQADIAVDQLLIGSYGTFAIESMAMGKPVLCYLRDDVRKIYPHSLPIVPTTPDSLVHDLRALIQQRQSWHRIGQAGVHYVNEVHEAKRIARRLVKVYDELIKAPYG